MFVSCTVTLCMCLRPLALMIHVLCCQYLSIVRIMCHNTVYLLCLLMSLEILFWNLLLFILWNWIKCLYVISVFFSILWRDFVINSVMSKNNSECQKHSYFTYLVRRPKFIAPHKLCLIEGRSRDKFFDALLLWIIFGYLDAYVVHVSEWSRSKAHLSVSGP